MAELDESKTFVERLVKSFLDLRLFIGFLFAIPYTVLGFFVEFALLQWEFGLLIYSFQQIICSLMVSIFLLPFIWITNDYFDAPYDFFDPVKRGRNYFCSEDNENNPSKGYLLIITLLLGSLVFSFFLSFELFVMTIVIAWIGYYYSAPPLRFKEMPVVDFVSHGFYAGGFFFLMGGAIISPLPILFTQPLFLVFLFLSLVDMSAIQFNSQLRDFEVDYQGKQRTTSQWLGKNGSQLLLRGLICSMMACLSLFLYLNSYTLVSLFSFPLLQLTFVLSIGGIFIYIWRTRGGYDKIKDIQRRSKWLRNRFIYFFVILSVILINPPI